MRGMLVVSVLVVMLVSHRATVNGLTSTALLAEEFPSKFYNLYDGANATLVPLMKLNIDLSLKQLFTSKQYSGQNVQRPGMAKLLAEESNRHWEDGINVLKKHLQIGGLVDDSFLNYFTFTGKGELGGVYIAQNYRNTMLNLVKTSRAMVNTLTDYHYVAIQSTTLPPYGDLDVAHFLSELAEKEAEIAYKMTTGYLIHESIASSGVALDMFDENL